MSKWLLDPKIDFVFKNIFGSEKYFLDDKFSRLDAKVETKRVF